MITQTSLYSSCIIKLHMPKNSIDQKILLTKIEWQLNQFDSLEVCYTPKLLTIIGSEYPEASVLNLQGDRQEKTFPAYYGEKITSEPRITKKDCQTLTFRRTAEKDAILGSLLNFVMA